MTIGDAEKVLAISKGFLFEPFGWYPRSSRNISDPTIRKTIEKYTRLDGAFIISEDGTIERLVQTITAPVASENLAVGLGSRHSAAAAISLFTEAVTIVVSQSGGNVSVFADGRSILSLKSS